MDKRENIFNIFNIYMSAAQEDSDDEEDFDTYLPVFLYSHAMFSGYDKNCKLADPKVSGEITEKGLYKSLITLDDFFTKVPKDMVLVDPIPSGLLCLSNWSTDELFPWFISAFGNKMFLNDKIPANELKNDHDISPSDIGALQQLYNNRKVYRSGDEVNNYTISFAKNTGVVPWGIRIPNYDDLLIEMVHEDWSRRYKDDHCIYLDEVLIKIREIVDKISTNKTKIMLYLVSCRYQPDYDHIYEDRPDFKQRLLERQHHVDTKGRNNVTSGLTTDRKLRTLPDGKRPGIFVYETETEKNYPARLIDIQRAIANIKGGKRQDKNKRCTRKKRGRKERKVKKGRARKSKQVKSKSRRV